ncbi:hypothetical protein PGUG_03468 [Meyerozyma guilliermondii ATCC 6260]|uniref:U6 snRNA phosphodiesterase n=1 Tax=Meyerozyma guilliermondii (strain ATCC 6260 / CBS 566 / DSM 6381 / JCM 1539 / NBRC 10279 / NRRL Y-324) TaxID=294746 RepID=A5DJL7_PICGU|nr:uncharacterized protein PGUG_03468 [Meyerozyma guilliermondii ATCC 6260]EDK39370.2 hypothetical protein PGUG_03468 [Meyerozyma guilliermondii ATCC 6260]
MDSIAGYSSDTSDTENESDTQLPSPDFSPFSENYFGNNNMASIFLHIPWNPPMQVANQLKTIAYDALRQLRQQHPEYISSYTWNAVGERTKSVHGKFSITNKYVLRTHHISLCSNIRGKPQNIDNFINDFKGEVTRMRIPPSMIQPEKTEQERAKSLNAILFRDQPPPSRTAQKYISLRLRPQLRLFRSFSSKSVFLAAVLDFSAPEEQAFFGQIWETITSNVDKSGVEIETFRNNKELKPPTLHVSLLYGEMNKKASQQYHEVNESLQSLHLDQLKDIQVCVDKVIISKLAKVHKTTSIPFVIEETTA